MELVFKCFYCGKTCKNDKSLSQHQRCCKLNPNQDLKSIKHTEYTCKVCNCKFNKKNELYEHYNIEHNITNHNGEQPRYNLICKYCNINKLTTRACMTLHEKSCKLNPNRVDGWSKNNKVKEETKNKISKSMHKAALEGRNKGWSITKSGPQHKSYPEKFFTKVIENEFDDKDYEYNKQFFTYKLDFAWEDKKKCIEIDGSQHERLIEQKESDIRKDKKLQENGWQVLRIKWKDMFNYPKLYIRIAKNFIDLETED